MHCYQAECESGDRLQIQVVEGSWGASNIEDVHLLLQNVADHFVRYLQDTPGWNIIVLPAAEGDDPMTCYRPTDTSPYLICLSARDRRWAQFSYQFAHELCHIASDYERLQGNPNNWFHESLCELASVFTLRCMAESWIREPPYPHWNNYASALHSYAENCLLRPERQLPTGVTLGRWLMSEEGSLRQDRYQRDKNAVVAYSCLPIVESDPMGWNAIRSLPDSSMMLQDYLNEWYSLAETVGKPFVSRIAELFEK